LTDIVKVLIHDRVGGEGKMERI